MSAQLLLKSVENAPCSLPGSRPGLDLEAAARCLRLGGVVIFPTETFYGLGCLAADAAAVAQVYQLKRRPVHKPLPLMAADEAQVDAIAHLADMPQALRIFWPGSLTVLLPARGSLPPALVNARGQVAVRVTPHPLAAELARRAGGALTSSSANLSGGAAARRPEELDPCLLAALDGVAPAGGQAAGACAVEGCHAVLMGGPLPAGGLPSTVVEPLPDACGGMTRLRVVRAGAVSGEELQAAGFVLE